jgi:hypothetical protein
VRDSGSATDISPGIATTSASLSSPRTEGASPLPGAPAAPPGCGRRSAPVRSVLSRFLQEEKSQRLRLGRSRTISTRFPIRLSTRWARTPRIRIRKDRRSGGWELRSRRPRLGGTRFARRGPAIFTAVGGPLPEQKILSPRARPALLGRKAMTVRPSSSMTIRKGKRGFLVCRVSGVRGHAVSDSTRSRRAGKVPGGKGAGGQSLAGGPRK